MILYFADRAMNILGSVSTQMSDALSVLDDKETQDIETGSAILELWLPITDETVVEMDKITYVGNYILFENEDGQARFCTIIRTERDRKGEEIYIYAEDAGLDLINEFLPAWTSPGSAQPMEYYVNKAIYDSGFEIGVNEMAHLSRTLSWDGEATAKERLLSIATQFDHAEIGFSFVVSGMVVVKKYVDIYQKRGNDTQLQLRINEDIDNIITTTTIENLATGYRVTGGTPEGSDKPITLQGYSYDDGDIYISGEYLLSRSALARWSRYISQSETGNDLGHIMRNYSYDTLSQQTLAANAITNLKKVYQEEINFEVDIAVLPENVRIGDQINIVDEAGELFIGARVLKIERSRSKGTAVATLGEFLIKESGIDARLQALADAIANIPQGRTPYPWIRYADDDKGNGFSSMPLNKSYIAIKYVFNEPIPSDDPADYVGLWTKFVGNDGAQGVQGPPGANGAPNYMWIMYADTVTGEGISPSPEGKRFIGISTNNIVETPSTDPKKYNWSAMYDEELLNNLQEQVDSITYPIISPYEPIDPKTGQTWWQQDINDSQSIIGYFVWDGSAWSPQTIQQSMLNVIALNAVTITGSEVTGTAINGSKFVNTFSYSLASGAVVTGVLTIEDGAITFEAVDTSGYKYNFEVSSKRGFLSSTEDVLGVRRTASIFDGNLALFKTSGTNIIGGTLTAENLETVAWTNIPLNSGWLTAEGNTPQYRKIKNLDGTTSVEFRGQVKRTTTITANDSHTFGTMAVGNRPSKNSFSHCATGAPYNGARVGALTTGGLRINTPVAIATDSYVAIDQLNYVI